MPQALEMVFHEASHIHPLEESVSAELEKAFQAAGGTPPDRFWHDLIFFTTGDVTRLVLEERRQPGYKHYGEFGLYQRGERWSVELPALEQHWRPYLQSASKEPDARRAALKALADEILTQGAGSR